MSTPLNPYLNLSNQLSSMIPVDGNGNYSWNGVMEFINNQMNASQERANEWKVERKKMQVSRLMRLKYTNLPHVS